MDEDITLDVAETVTGLPAAVLDTWADDAGTHAWNRHLLAAAGTAATVLRAGADLDVARHVFRTLALIAPADWPPHLFVTADGRVTGTPAGSGWVVDTEAVIRACRAALAVTA